MPPNEFWNGYPDYWDDFEFRELVEIIWRNWKDKVDELAGLFQQLDDSKSILTLPYQLEKRWLKLVFEPGETTSRPVEGEDQLLDIPVLLDTGYRPVNVPFRVDREANAVVLETTDPLELDPLRSETGHIELWAEYYYVHNPMVTRFYAPLLGLGDLTQRFDTAYGIKPYSAMFYRIVKGLWYVFVKGPTIENMEQGISIIYNIPVALRSGTISKIETTGMRTVIEIVPDDDYRPPIDRWVFSANFFCPFKVGDHVAAGTTLVYGSAEVLDYINSPGWWLLYARESERKKLDLVERYCTALIKLNAESYFQEQRTGETEGGTGLLHEYVENVLPSYVNMMLLLFHYWVEVVEPPSEDLARHLAIRWYETPYRDENGVQLNAACITPLGDPEDGVNTYAKRDGIYPYQDGPLLRHHLPLKHVIHTKGRLFVPRDSEVVGVEVLDGTPVTILSRGPHWIDVDYLGLDSDIVARFRRIDYAHAGGYDAWMRTIHVQEWAYAHGYDSKTQKFVMPADGINVITQIQVPSTLFGAPEITLVPGVDYWITYNRTSIGTGTFEIDFLTGEHRELYVEVLLVPCAPSPLDKNGNPVAHGPAEYIGDEMTIKVRIANIDEIEYRDGQFYHGDDLVHIGSEIPLPIYDGTYNFDGEIVNFGEHYGLHFYKEIIVT